MIEPWRAVLDRYPASVQPTSEPRSIGNAGGLSGARLWRFESGLGPLVARSWPSDGPNLDQLATIHAWLASSADLGFVPVPISAIGGRSIVSIDGRLWEVTPWITGVADLDRPPKLARLRAMFSGLAAFHARLASIRTQGTSPGLANRFQEVNRLILGEFDRFRLAINRASTADPCVSMARSWLDQAVSRAPELAMSLRQASAETLPIQPCLRDARPDHFLFEGDRLTGLVDFGAMGRDSVAGDLARLLAESVGSDRPARLEALAAFESIRPLSGVEVRAIGAFERANALLGAGRWVRWHFLEHRVFEDPEAIVRGLRRGLERLIESEGTSS